VDLKNENEFSGWEMNLGSEKDTDGFGIMVTTQSLLFFMELLQKILLSSRRVGDNKKTKEKKEKVVNSLKKTAKLLQNVNIDDLTGINAPPSPSIEKHSSIDSNPTPVLDLLKQDDCDIAVGSTVEDYDNLRRSAPYSLTIHKDKAFENENQTTMPMSIAHLLLRVLFTLVLPLSSLPSLDFDGKNSVEARWDATWDERWWIPPRDVTFVWKSILDILVLADPAAGKDFVLFIV
jgi:hypothetical protein